MLSATALVSDRLRLRKARADDLEGIVDTQTDPDIRRYLGGPRPEHAVREHIATVGIEHVTANPGVYVIADRDTDEMVGTLTLARRNASQPGHIDDSGGELELSYVLRRRAWGRGYATEAARTVLRAAAEELPDQPVLIITQSANSASLRLANRLGFRAVTTFEQWGAEQTLAVAALHSFQAS